MYLSFIGASLKEDDNVYGGFYKPVSGKVLPSTHMTVPSIACPILWPSIGKLPIIYLKISQLSYTLYNMMIKKYLKKILKTFTTNNYSPLNRVEINKQRLLHNLSVLQLQHSCFSIIPVLKSNAYGHGLTQISQILNSADCDLLAVDGYFEAAKIREITNHRILVMGYIKPENVKLLDVKKCSFVVQDSDGLKALGSLQKPANIHIELNTGMNRLGLQPNELNKYLRTLKSFPKLKLEGIMTHLADADNEIDSSYTDQQVQIFDSLVESILNQGFKPKYIHIAQTAGSTKAFSKYANSLRLGIGLYGINPLTATDKHFNAMSELLPVLELKSTIIKVIDLKSGDRVSYNGIFKASKPMRIAVLPLGYYEGISRELSNRGIITHDNYRLPIVGRVCMNHTMIDLGSSNLKVGDEVTIISSDSNKPNSIIQMCKLNHLFSYILLTGISSSVKRIIV